LRGGPKHIGFDGKTDFNGVSSCGTSVHPLRAGGKKKKGEKKGGQFQSCGEHKREKGGLK